MKKNILNEVNKIREMMGLINEQETGCIEGDCENGTGTYLWDRDIFFEGDGIRKYEGEWRDGRRQGFGKMEFENGDRFEGLWMPDSRYDNESSMVKGTYTFANGDVYKGEWEGSTINGTGTYTYVNGDKYEGPWKGGRPNGNGTYTWEDGSKYEGGFHWMYGNSVHGSGGGKHGKGTLTCVDGTKHEQEWKEGKLISGGSCDENSNNNTGSQGDNTFPENWKEGINNKGWVLMKGSHGHEGKIPDTKKAIEFIQAKVGLSGDDVDGLYGSNTVKKVWNYQENNGLKPDGKVGKNTLAKMLS